MKFRHIGLMVLLVGCGGSHEDGEAETDDGSGADMPPGDEDGLWPAWMVRAKVGRMEASDFVEAASKDFASEESPGGGVGLIEARFGNTREIIVALPTPDDMWRMDSSLENEVKVRTLRETGVDALDLDGDGLDEVVNFIGDLSPRELVVLSGTQAPGNWGPALRYPLDYRPEGIALVPASSSREPGISVCFEDQTMNSSAPARIAVLEWRDGTVAERWNVAVGDMWCGFNVAAEVAGEPAIVVATDSSRVLAFREAEDEPFGSFQAPEQLRNGLLVADARGDGTPMVVMDSLVRQTDTVDDHLITAVPLTVEGFGEPVTGEAEWVSSFSAGDIDGDGADEILLAQYGGVLQIVELMGDALVISTEYTFDDLAQARAHAPWAAVPMDLSDSPADELVVVGYPYEIYD